MKNLQLLISVSISEFEVLRDFGLIRVDSSRLIVTETSNDDKYPIEVDAQLLAKLPEFLPNEDQSLLVLAFRTHSALARHDDPLSGLISGRVVLSIRHCTHVFPLTARARQILTGRLSGQVVLQQPIFEDIFVSHLANMEKQASYCGAISLVETMVANHLEFNQEALRDAMFDSEHPLSKFLHSAVRFTRHKPMPKEPVSGLRDLGGLLKDMDSSDRELLLPKLAQWLRPKQEDLLGFQKVYSDSNLIEILRRITEFWLLPASAAGIAVFLHWRELALRAGGIDANALATDCRELAGCLDGQAVVDALWLLGFSSGYEAVAPAFCRTLGEKHPFNPTGRSNYRVTLLAIPSVVKSAIMTQATQESEVQTTAAQAEEIDETKTDPIPAEPLNPAPEIKAAVLSEEPLKVTETASSKITANSEDQDIPNTIVFAAEINVSPIPTDSSQEAKTEATIDPHSSPILDSSIVDTSPGPIEQLVTKNKNKKPSKNSKKNDKKSTANELFSDNS
jgi:hypothetical protein